jgi:hypothetical protein
MALSPFRAGDLAVIAPALAAAARPAALRPELEPRALAEALIARGVLAGLRVGASSRGSEAHLLLDPRALGLADSGPIEVRLVQGPRGVVATLCRPEGASSTDPGLARLLEGLARGLRARGVATELET